MDGFLLIDKPIYWTSFDVIRYIRKITDRKLHLKLGHTGTLDPIAQGLLILCFGKATKCVNSLMNEEKEYITTIKLGETRDTDDITGKLISKKLVPQLSAKKISETLVDFTGEITQVPPLYSALKFRGTAFYKLARAGHNIERKPRKVNISSITLQKYSPPSLEIKVVCGRGTYIRALARDLGEKLGCGACMESLVRTRIGKFYLSSACSPDAIHSIDELKKLIISLHNQGLEAFPTNLCE